MQTVSVTATLNIDELPAEWLVYGVKLGIPEAAVRAEWENFKFYYLNGKGAEVTRGKRGWSGAWQNWVRKTAVRGTFYQLPAKVEPLPPKPALEPELEAVLVKLFDAGIIDRWWRNCTIKRGSDGAWHFMAKSQFMADWITRHYSGTLAAMVRHRIYLPTGKLWFDSGKL